MPVPVIAAGISAIGGIVANKMANNAASKAAEQQVASGDRALNVIQEAYSPYMQMGVASLGQLGANLGIPIGAAPGQPTQAVDPLSGSRPRDGRPITGHAVPRGSVPMQPEAPPRRWSSLGDLAATPQTHARQQTQSGFAGGSGGMVMLEAPDGTRQAVPEAQAVHYESRGARRVG